MSADIGPQQMKSLSDAELKVLRDATGKLADETQRQAARYQRTRSQASRELKRRRKAAKE